MQKANQYKRHSYKPLLCTAVSVALCAALELFLHTAVGAELAAKAAVGLWLLRMGLHILLLLAALATAFNLCAAIFRYARDWRAFSREERQSATVFVTVNLLGVLFCFV